MPFVGSTKDVEALTLTFVAEFPATVERVWRLWEDPRQLERWWGPPGFPATFTRHDFTVPGRSVYYMTSPEGVRHYGWWAFESIAPPRSLELVDGFGDEQGNPAPEMPAPSESAVTIEPTDSGARLTIVSTFSSAEQLEALVEMGMEEGMRQSLDQIDALLAESAG